MEVIKPTPVKIPEPLRKAAKEFAEKKEGGNMSRLVRKALAKYIKYQEPVKQN